MTTASRFSVQLDISDIPDPAKSVAAHLGAKLELFQTDERTLTDELCDMLCIWFQIQAARPQPGTFPLTLNLSKTTAAEEAKIGADLELIVSTPLGVKRCLVQAKVQDPVTWQLRCDSADGWKKLRKQLIAARNEVGNLAFLLVYVPGALMNGASYGFQTYEQESLDPALGDVPAYYGATLIAVDDLLGRSGRWRSRKFKVRQTELGHFTDGVPFWRFLIELFLCRRGSWSTLRQPESAAQTTPFRTLGIDIAGMEPDRWAYIQHAAEFLLNEDPDSGQG